MPPGGGVLPGPATRLAPPGSGARVTGPPAAAGALCRAGVEGPPGGADGTVVRPPADDGGAADEGEPVELLRLGAGAAGSIFRIESPTDRSVSRVVCAVAFVLAPALSAADAAISAELRAVLMARSACCMATWPNTPALPLLALMFSLLDTALRTWSPRLAILPPRFSTASGSMRVPRPPTPPAEGDDDEAGGLLR
ncbi:hypothetical protein [Lentzea flaviverrucosa]|uniref:hypothetical protein n=1 Tax=Lentzea flaviverrucosa TaxID=200379 RepID=UPI0011C02CD6|nr:hypothetical protein [Lentzea flaviverrucosa]